MTARQKARMLVVEGKSSPDVAPWSSAPTELSIRLWTPALLRRAPEAPSWNADSALVYMLADLVRASDGAASGESRDALVARFDSPGRAVTAARRIQRSVHEFAQHRSEDCFGVSIGIHSSPGLHAVGDSAIRTRGVTLDRAAPAQILVAPDTYASLQSVPGLLFRSLPGDGSTAPDRELVWTTPEIYQWFDELLQRGKQAAAAAEDERTAEIPSPQTRLWSSQEAAAPDGSAAPLSQPVPSPDDLPADRSWIDLPIVRRSLMAAVGILLALAAVLIFSPSRIFQPRTEPAAQTLPQAPPPGETKPDQPAVPVSKAAETGSNAGDIRETEPPVPIAPAHVESKRRAKAPAEPTEHARTDYDGFTSREIPQLLRRADEDAGAGNYAQARREYEIVLKLDPANAIAKQGLHRLELRESQRNH